MNPPVVPPQMPNAPKKGTSVLAIVGMGCGVLALVVLVGGFLLMRACTSKLKDFANDMEKNPAKTTALLAVKMNPDLELVSTNDATNEITVRDKKSGEVTTLSFNDIAQGKFKYKNSKGEEVTIDAANQGGKGNIVVKDKNGTTVISGDAQSAPPPPWVPTYPGAQNAGGMRSEKADKVSGMYGTETTDAPAKVKDFFEPKLKAGGFEVETSTISGGNGEIITLKATKDGDKQTLTVIITTDNGKTRIAINYDGPKS
jgi:hypothetical protein